MKSNKQAFEVTSDQPLDEEFVLTEADEAKAITLAVAEGTYTSEPLSSETMLQDEHKVGTDTDVSNPADDDSQAEKPKKPRKGAKRAESHIEGETDNEASTPKLISATSLLDHVSGSEVKEFEVAVDVETITEPASAVETVFSETLQADPATDSEHPSQTAQQRLRRARRRTGAVTIDGGISDLTDEARKRNDLIDLTESLRSKKILSGYIHGVESIGDSNVPSYAVIYHGAYKIVIPVEELVVVPDGAEQNYLSAMVSRRLGAQIEFIIKGIDEKNGMAAASRLDAMRIRRREFFVRKDEEGNPLLRQGSEAEARVVCVLRRGIFVELFGVESFIPLVELSHLRINNATEHFSSGDRVLVKILSISNVKDGNLRIELSVRQANEDIILRALERYIPGNLYAGIVSMISPAGVFVALEDVSCLCAFPPRGRPALGAKVCVRIRGVNLEKRRLWGLIVR